MELKTLTKNRTSLMGFAILCIMLCHNSLIGNQNFMIINDFIKSFLQVGVDIFLLLSAIGCCYSFNKSNLNIKLFYQKRFFRILPTYIFIVFFYGILNCGILGNNIYEYIYRYSLISFFSSGILSQWFIAAILVLYLLFPFYYLIYKQDQFKYLLLIIFVLLLSLIFSFFNTSVEAFNIVNEIFVIRIPIFLIGIVIGDSLYNNSNIIIKKEYVIITFIIMILLFFINYHANSFNKEVISRIIFCPLSLTLSMILGNIMSKIKILVKLYNFLGQITLELYLMHEGMILICYFMCKQLFTSEIYVLWIANLLAIIMAIIAAVIVKNIISLLTKNVML